MGLGARLRVAYMRNLRVSIWKDARACRPHPNGGWQPSVIEQRLPAAWQRLPGPWTGESCVPHAATKDLYSELGAMVLGWRPTMAVSPAIPDFPISDLAPVDLSERRSRISLNRHQKRVLAQKQPCFSLKKWLVVNLRVAGHPVRRCVSHLLWFSWRHILTSQPLTRTRLLSAHCSAISPYSFFLHIFEFWVDFGVHVQYKGICDAL